VIASSPARRRELALAVLGFGALSVALTFPLAFQLGTTARVDNGDGQFSIWNVAWVARTLVVDPLHVFDANIFYPHRWTLTYSETNLGAGFLAVPAYWLTRNPYAAHNFVLILSFVLSGVGTYYLVRYLTQSSAAASVSGICFAFCPYVFAHTAHIQLLMTAGLPFSLLALHRLSDSPSVPRGVELGLVLAAQAYFCGYYAIFAVLIVGFAALLVAAMRGRWLDRDYWFAIGVAVLVSVVAVLPVMIPYLIHQRSTGFTRSLASARSFSAAWPAYFSSGAYAHQWLGTLGLQWKAEPLFPGFVAVVVGAIGLVASWRAGGRLREVAAIYGGLTLLAGWASLGPAAGLYSVLYRAIPVFSFLRAPSRFGLIVDLALAVLAGVALSRIELGDLRRAPRRRTLVVVAVAAIAVAELIEPIHFPRVPPVEPAYRVLASLPSGPVLELPVYSPQFAFARERYMLDSTTHWMPLIDAYSDYIPEDFGRNAEALGSFPSREAFAVLEPIRGRYAVIHVNTYSAEARADLVKRLAEFSPYLARRFADDRIWLYEIVGSPR
jgi:hypothetical protein